MQPEIDRWLATHTWAMRDWDAHDVAAGAATKRQTVAVVLPALNEEATVGTIVDAIRSHLVRGAGLVSDLVVVDSGSTDATASIAAEAGARVVSRTDVLPDVPVRPGKGEAMWRGLAATTADIVVFIDADLQSFTADYVAALVGPLVSDPALHLVKAIYERPLVAGESVIPAGGGRVTELVARPLLNQFWPELAGVVQPLAGEYAGRRTLLESLPFPCGYGVEIALLVDTFERHGLGAIGQVDLGVRVHRHHDDQGLGVMAAEILDTAIRRLPGHVARQQAELLQFERTAHGYHAMARTLAITERPPLAQLRYGRDAATRFDL